LIYEYEMKSVPFGVDRGGIIAIVCHEEFVAFRIMRTDIVGFVGVSVDVSKRRSERGRGDSADGRRGECGCGNSGQ
jgi:hypothetical protein